MSPELDVDRAREALEEARTVGDLRAIDLIEKALDAELQWRPQEYQRPPPGEWAWWVLSAGAGAGKTDAGAYDLDAHMQGPPCDTRVPGGHKALVCGPSFGDAIATCWRAPAGLSVHNEDLELISRKGNTYVVWPSGAEAVVSGLYTERESELLRARAANCCRVWIDEGALAPFLSTAVDIIVQRARLGKDPRFVVTSTPKPTPGWKHLLGQDGVHVTYASSYDNAYLPDIVRKRLERFEGTAWGMQEIHGQMLEYFAGALWRRDDVEADQVSEPPPLSRIFVGVDPSTWQPDFGDDPGTVAQGLETGVVVVGVDRNPRGEQHAYILEDASGRYAAEEAAQTIVRCYRHWSELAPAQIVIERNMGAGVYEMVRTVDPDVKFYRDPANPKRVGVHAAHAKRARAEPISALYDKHVVHHVKPYQPLLVGQMCLWDPNENWSPDRLDALVWALTACALWSGPGGTGTSFSGDPIPRSPRF